jgi:hypothetical protein
VELGGTKDDRPVLSLPDLEGRWQLSRRIEDRKAGLTGRFDGVSVWRPDGVGLRQEESGVLHYGDATPMQASRVYLWRAEAADVAVYFEDGRPFHRLAPGQVSDRHLCAPDTYDVTYDLTEWPVWTQTWVVVGPRKDSTLISRFTRLTPGA